MKKNRKGFTLVELLATIVIIGILAVFAVPLLTSTLDRSRSKMYVNDAKRLIAQAEYELKASSSTIEKPDSGNCIVISLAYLNTTAISAGPNGGEYDPSSSFVVVKNVSGQMEYSVALIEHLKKGGYRGIELTKGANLYNSDAYSRVKNLTKSDLVDVDGGITKSYVNSKIGANYVTNVTKVYHTREIVDPNIQSIKTSTPVIKSIRIDSKSGAATGALIATLSLKADDKDTPRNSLTVIIKVNGTQIANVKYATEGTAFFNYDINFGSTTLNYNYQNGGEVTVNVTVKDPENNSTSQSVTYTIHKNNPPQVEGNGPSLGVTDPVNTPYKAFIRMNLSDDLTATNELKVCFSETQVQTCSPYQNYVTNGDMYYEFQNCTGGCKRDGSNHNLYIYIKDKHEAVTKLPAVVYTFPKNQKPSVASFTITPDGFQGINKVKIKPVVSDDMDVKKLTMYISDGTSTKSMKYNGAGTEYAFTISGAYDGSVKTITVYVKDTEGAQSDVARQNYTMYLNQAPTISDIHIESNDDPCIHEKVCNTGGGSLDTTVTYSVSDDITATNQIKVCMSESPTYCNTTSNFTAYSEAGKRFIFNGNYDGGTRTLYFKAMDSLGVVAERQVTYHVYQDNVPLPIATPYVSRTDNPYNINLLDLYLYTNMQDDIDNRLMYWICYQFDDGEETCGEQLLSTTGVFHLDDSYFTEGFTDYHGQTLKLYAKVKDNFNDPVDTATVYYPLYSNVAPTIVSSGIMYEDDLTATVSFSVRDYFDEYQVGVQVGDNCNGVVYNDEFYDGNDLEIYTIPYLYEDTPTDSVLCVKDRTGEVTVTVITPVKSSEYVMCSNQDHSRATYEYSVAAGQQGITKERCNNKCYAYNPLTEEENTVTGFYNRSISYFDHYNSLHSCPANTDDYTANCSFKDCFHTGDTYHRAVGVVPVYDDVVWTVNYDGRTYRCYSHYKMYQSSYNEGDENITLAEIEGQKVCSALAEVSDYMSDYVRVVDQFGE